ncbi:MAG: DUF1080 domain-containing protein [Fimbriimonadaceae bacterium]|nr:MAG: DUF1080 domain-containing protein [Fimbriimonadaceae bacterium]
MLTTLVTALLLAQPAQPAPQRPRDIWVFRSVLDQNARMLTAALSNDLWVAYDTKTCSLYKAWTGGVKFDGAVYTTVHGPQPTSIGEPYLLNRAKNTWSFGPTEVKPRYLGYKIVNKQLQFRFELTAEDKQKVQITEVPEYVPSASGTVTLERTFTVSGLKPSQNLRLTLFQANNARLVSSGTTVTPSNTGIVPPGDPNVPTHAFMVKNGTSKLTLAFPKSGTPGGVHQDEDGDPTPAPAPQQDVSKEREPGLSMRLYYIGIDMNKIPQLISGQTPNYSVIIPQVKLGSDSFDEYDDNFLLHVTGFITAPEAGSYEFELSSDDGSRLMIGDNLIVDHDGLHGKTAKTGRAEMVKGENRIFIEMFENYADAALELRWKKPGDKEFTLVPASALSTPAGEVRVTAPGKKRVIGIDNFRPGDRRPLEDVHPSYNLTTVRPESFKPRVGGIGFLPNGDMLVCTWDPDGAVYQLSGWTGPREKIKVKRIAAGLAEPLGLKVVKGRIYVLQKQELSELIDNDKDGVIDEYRCVANGWGVTANFHEFCFGLEYKDGKFYGNLATAINPGGSSTQPQNPDRGRTLEIDEKTGEYHFILAGLRTPNGIGFGALGKLYISDNQGDWLPSSKIMLVKEGAFYGNRSVEPVAKANTPEDPPVVWLPQNEIGNSPSQIAALNDGVYKGQMVHGDVTHGGLKRVFVEEVDGVLQGTVFRMTQGIEAGVNRVVLAPDGSFVLGGIGSSGNWGQTGKVSYGLQRLVFNKKSTFEMLSASPRKNGVVVRFTEPLDPMVGNVPAYYEVQQWHYVPTKEYGGPKVDEENLTVKSVTVSKDRKSVFLELNGLKEGHVAYIRVHPSLQSVDHEFAWSTEAWMTINKIPNSMGAVVKQVPPATEPAKPTMLTSSMNNFTGWNNKPVPAGWKLQGGILSFTPGAGGGDLKTVKTYSNFEMTWEWKIGPGGNSGVIYLSEDKGSGYPWETGPEYQILDNSKHADGLNPLTSAASLYAVYPIDFDYTRPVGEWNVSRLVVKDGKVEHWLNHKLIVSADLNSKDFADKVMASKFKDMPGYGKVKRGHIVFQDHGDPVSYRKIVITGN